MRPLCAKRAECIHPHLSDSRTSKSAYRGGKKSTSSPLGQSVVVFLFAVTAGLFTVGLLLAAGACGYALAHAPGNRGVLVAISTASVVMIGVTGAVLGSMTYTKIATVAVPALPARATPGASPVGSQSEPTSTEPRAPQAAIDAWMHFQSDTGDYIGGGKQQVWTLKESDFSVGGNNRDIRASVSGQGDRWYLEFRAPSNGQLGAGQFTNAERAPFVTGKAPGLDINGDGRGCNTLGGRFAIKTLTWTSAGTVAEMDVLFEQHCEGMGPALRGELWITTTLGVHRTPPTASSSVAL